MGLGVPEGRGTKNLRKVRWRDGGREWNTGTWTQSVELTSVGGVPVCVYGCGVGPVCVRGGLLFSEVFPPRLRPDLVWTGKTRCRDRLRRLQMKSR